jgi:hypothetical protein
MLFGGFVHHRGVPGRFPHQADVGGHRGRQGFGQRGMDIADDHVAHRAGRRGHGHFDHQATGGELDTIDQSEGNDVPADLGVDDLAQDVAHLLFVEGGFFFRHDFLKQ